MARPSQKRTVVLRVRLTAEEYARLKHSADTAAVDISTLARAQIMDGPIPRRARRVSCDHTAFARAMGQLGHLGSNVNQIAKHINAAGDLTQFRRAVHLDTEITAMRQMLWDAIHP
jgi:hypothetical protein